MCTDLKYYAEEEGFEPPVPCGTTVFIDGVAAMTPEPLSCDDDPELLVAEVTEDFLRRIELGEEPDVADYAERYPAIADLLRQ